MRDEMVYVIKDVTGSFISPKATKRGWYYLKYSGIADGFTCYKNKQIMLHKLNHLNNLGNNFNWEYVNLKLIPKGKRIKT